MFVDPSNLEEVISHHPQTLDDQYRTRPSNLYILCNGSLLKNITNPTEDDYGAIYYDLQTGCFLPLHETWIDEVRNKLNAKLSILRPCFMTHSEWKYIVSKDVIPSLNKIGISPKPSNIYLPPDDPNQIYSVEWSQITQLKDAKIQYNWFNLAVPHSNIIVYKDYRVVLEQFGIHANVFKSGSQRNIRIDAENIIAWDIEAYANPDGEFVPYCLCTSTNNVYWGTDCVSNFLGRLLAEVDNSSTDVYYLAHNGSGFDHLFLLREFLRNGIVPWVVMDYKRLYGIDYKRFHFRDSCMIYPSRLMEFCRIMGSEVQKGQFDHEKVSPDNFNEFRVESSKYCLQDCISLRQAWEIYRDKLWNLCKFEITGQYSINAACYNLFANRYMNADITTATVNDINTFHTSNYPATIHLFTPGVYTGVMKRCRLSSLYLTVMQGTVPTSFRVHRTGSQPGLIVDHYLYMVRMIKFPDGELVNLPVRGPDGEVVYPREQTNQLRWGVELKTAIHLGAQFTCDEWYEFNDAPIFREYSSIMESADSTIRELYATRIKCKFEQRFSTTMKIVHHDDIKQLIHNHRIDNLQPMITNYFLATVEQQSPAEPNQFVHIASYINAAIRSLLSSYIMTFGRENVIYCGYDSMIIRGNVSGLESTDVSHAIVINQSTYGYISSNGEQTVVIKGIPRTKVDNRFDLLQRLAEGYQLNINWKEFRRENMVGVRLIDRQQSLSVSDTPVGVMEV